MLTVEDKNEVREIVRTELGDFYEKLLQPYFERLEETNLSLKENIGELKQNVIDLKINQQLLSENLIELSKISKDHDTRLKKVETLTRS